MPVRSAPRAIEALIDESMFDDPILTLAGAVVFQTRREATDRRIESLYAELSELYFMDGERSYNKFLKNGFHAADDQPEISTAFIRLLSQDPTAKLFIEYSDHSRRPDLSREQTIALLEIRLAETIMRRCHNFDQVRFTFEQNTSLDQHFKAIVEAAVTRSGFKGNVSVATGSKMEPPTLAVVDYALASYGRAHQNGAQQHHKRTWQAIRPMVSSVRSLDAGGVDLRRGLR